MVRSVLKELTAASHDSFLTICQLFYHSRPFCFECTCVVFLLNAIWFDILLSHAISSTFKFFLKHRMCRWVSKCRPLQTNVSVLVINVRFGHFISHIHSFRHSFDTRTCNFSKQRPFNYNWQTAKQTEH